MITEYFVRHNAKLCTLLWFCLMLEYGNSPCPVYKSLQDAALHIIHPGFMNQWYSGCWQCDDLLDIEGCYLLVNAQICLLVFVSKMETSQKQNWKFTYHAKRMFYLYNIQTWVWTWQEAICVYMWYGLYIHFIKGLF